MIMVTNTADCLSRLSSIASSLGCRRLADVVLNDKRFPLWSGSSKPHKHHYGMGKLSQHILEVTEIALSNNEYFTSIGKGVDNVKLYLSCLYHDVGKLWDYEPVDVNYSEWRSSEHRHTIHHISRSGIVWCEAAKSEGWQSSDIDEVLHCILSHHGLQEWGSPVQPQSRMAWLLHLSDCMSARMDDFDKRRPFSVDSK